VVITRVGDTNVDEEQQLTGIPYCAVSKAPTSSYATTIRLIGQLVGQKKRADEMADFWAKTIQSVEDRAAKAPWRPRVLYTGKNGDSLSAPGRNTVFGSTLDTAGGQSVGDQLPSAFASKEINTVTLEQILEWNPDVIIASGAAARNKIMTDPQWRTLKAVQARRVYAPRAFAGLDGLQAVLGMVWAQGVLLDGDDAAAEAHLTSVMQSYYKLFYGRTLTAAQIAQPAA
jgi:iron complex transport system substrate-binding protein